MNLEQLSERVIELEKAIANMSQNLYMLHGHKAEAAFHLEEAKKAAEAIAVPVEPPVE